MKIKNDSVKDELSDIKDILLNAYQAYGNTPKDTHILRAMGRVETLINIIDWEED